MTDLATLTERTQRLVGALDGQRNRVDALTAEVADLEADVTLLTVTQATIDTLLQTMTAESVGKVERLVTYGLQTVFPDQQLSFRFDITTKYQQPWLEPRLVDGGIDQPILDAFGGGPASLVAFILRVVVVSRMKLAPVILLDEPFAMVSTDGGYVDRVGSLLKHLCQSLGLTIVMVSQQPKFLDHADQAYSVEGSPHGPTGTTFAKLVGGGSRLSRD